MPRMADDQHEHPDTVDLNFRFKFHSTGVLLVSAEDVMRNVLFGVQAFEVGEDQYGAPVDDVVERLEHIAKMLKANKPIWQQMHDVYGAGGFN